MELCSKFEPFEPAAVQTALERAWQANERAVVIRVRGMDKEVTLVPPMLQRAAGNAAPGRERKVRRRVLNCIELGD